MLLALGILVVIDGALCGFRAAAGRNPRIFLGRYYRRSMRRGAWLALVVIALFLAVGLGLRAAGGDGTWASLLAAASRLVRFYGLFASVVVLALGLYLLGHFDLGVLASVLVLGPLTSIRPLVIVAGAGWAAARADTLAATLMSLSAGLVMATFERLLALGHPPWRGLEGDPQRRDRPLP